MPKVRIQPNYDKATDKDCFGVSLKIEGSRIYSKYPIGMQSYPTKEEALKAKAEVESLLSKGAIIEYSSVRAVGMRKWTEKHEYVKIVMPETTQ